LHLEAAGDMTGRLLLDVSSLLCWVGPPVGIARVEHALAMAALHRPNTELACYDPSTGRFRALNPVWRDRLLGWSAALDSHRPLPERRGPRLLRSGRQPIVAALERLRLTTRHQAVADAADRAQRAVLAIRPHRFSLTDAAGARIDHVPRDFALGEDLRPGPGDTLLAGQAWFDRDPAVLVPMVQAAGFRYAALCFDLIPITHPQFFQPDIAKLFHTYWRGILPIANPVLVTAACIAEDVRRFWHANGAPAPRIRQCPLGYDPPPLGTGAPLPDGPRPGHYALFVSTIEPRKGHATLLRVWRRLLARGIPQRSGFQLVFVGRPGWMVDDVLADLADPAFRGNVLHLTGIDEAALNALYAGAAFCLYPSAYEGFGLPVIEAYARGKAVIASSGGALRQTVGGLSPCLDPGDDDAWEAAITTWIEHPEAIAAAEAHIRDRFAHPAWPEAAAAVLDAAAA